VVARLDGSGTTFAFTNHLSAASAAWREGPGVGTRVNLVGLLGQKRVHPGVPQPYEGVSRTLIGVVLPVGVPPPQHLRAAAAPNREKGRIASSEGRQH